MTIWKDVWKDVWKEAPPNDRKVLVLAFGDLYCGFIEDYEDGKNLHQAWLYPALATSEACVFDPETPCQEDRITHWCDLPTLSSGECESDRMAREFRRAKNKENEGDDENDSHFYLT